MQIYCKEVFMDLTKMNAALQELRSKYAVANNGEIIAAPCGDMGAGAILKCCCGKSIPLLPWRKERRFFELKNLVDTNTLEDVSTLRFAWIASEKTLPQLLYRELDLCEYIGESPIVSIFATLGGDKTANAIVKLADTKSCSVECSAGLPKGAEEIDKHEIIARRGIGCDRVVDSQIPCLPFMNLPRKGKNALPMWIQNFTVFPQKRSGSSVRLLKFFPNRNLLISGSKRMHPSVRKLPQHWKQKRTGQLPFSVRRIER